MTDQLLSRLDALAEVAADVRARLDGPDADRLDGLAVARLLVAVDGAVKRLGKLAGELRPALFPAADADGAAPKE